MTQPAKVPAAHALTCCDTFSAPSGWQWSQAARSKGKWIALLVIGLALPGGGLLLAMIYFFFTQPALKRSRPPILPPGGVYNSSGR